MIGSAAAYWLSRSLGDRVLGLERFDLDHANGASADHSRIIRLSYHRPDYVRLAKWAYETWAAVEAEAGERIVTVTGGLDLWPADAAIPQIGYTDSLTAEGVPFDLVDADELRRRWPQWRLADDVTAMWQRHGGLADPFRATAPGASPGRAATLRETRP
jgi:sarcosine oxidase